MVDSLRKAKRVHAGRQLARTCQSKGTTLIEVLVVMVILLIGILGVIQIFPGGFGVLRVTRGNTQATELSKAEVERIKGYSHQLPEEIRCVMYSFIGSSIVSIVADTTRRPDDLMPAGDGLDNGGNILINGQTQQLGKWPFVSGANLFRRVIGEGGPVPAARQVGTQFGGLMVLQFAPIEYNPAFPILLQVYGNDLVRRDGAPSFGRNRDYQYFVEDADLPSARIHVPRDTVKTRAYRLQVTAWFNNPGAQFQEIETQIVVPPDPLGGYAAYDIATLPGFLGFGTFNGVEFGSVRLARLFDQVANSAAFTPDPYEFVLLDANLGVMLFNPRGFDYKELRPGNRRIPLIARVNYDVFDWRILRDEFRVPDGEPFQIRTKLPGIKNKGGLDTDEQNYNGIDIPVSDGNGGTQNIDVILLDVATGGVYLFDPSYPPDPNPEPGVVNDYLRVDPARSSYAVDSSTGFFRFRDYDRTTPGLQLRLIYPGDATPTTVNAEGRTIRALYQARGEWAVQVLKTPARFRLTYGSPQLAEYYIGGTGVPGGSPTRIYFPATEGGKNVTIGEIWYVDAASNPRVLNDQNFTIQTTPFDPLGPYVDISTLDPTATAFDFGNGYAVRYVRGASLVVRTLWNPAMFTVASNNTQNWENFVLWSRTWKRNTVDTYLQRGDY